MTSPDGKLPENKNCRFADSEPTYDTKEEALLILDDKQSEFKKTALPGVSIVFPADND